VSGLRVALLPAARPPEANALPNSKCTTAR
jgi:hypothetical protein